jgi:hypothetical protein
LVGQLEDIVEAEAGAKVHPGILRAFEGWEVAMVRTLSLVCSFSSTLTFLRVAIEISLGAY